MVNEKTHSQLTIINDILDFSKIEAGRIELEAHPFDLRTCIGDAVDLFANLAQKNRPDGQRHEGRS